jgi:hypothetical protein
MEHVNRRFRDLALQLPEEAIVLILLTGLPKSFDT